MMTLTYFIRWPMHLNGEIVKMSFEEKKKDLWFWKTIYINYDPGITLTYFTAIGHPCIWTGKIVKMSFEGENLNWLKIYDSEKKMDPRDWSAPAPGQYTCLLL